MPLENKVTNVTIARSSLFLIGVGIVYALAVLVSYKLTYLAIPALWIPSGLLAGYLTLRRRREWPLVLGVAFLADLVVEINVREHLWIALALAAFHLLDAFIVALAIEFFGCRRHQMPESLDRSAIGCFALLPLTAAAALGAIVSGLIPAALGYFTQVEYFWSALEVWAIAHCLGTMLFAPIIPLIFEREFISMLRGRKLAPTLLGFALIVSAACVLFAQSRLPMFALIFPLLILVVFRRGLHAALPTLAAISVIAAAFTVHGLGPLKALHGNITLHIVYLQVLLAVALWTIIPVAEVLDARNRLYHLYHLLATNSRDLVVRTSLDGRRLYVSPSFTEVLGWQPEELLGRPSSEIMHPDELDTFSDLLQRLKEGTSELLHVYRIRKKDGSYLWMEAHACAVRDPETGEPIEFVGTSRNITERISAELRLTSAYRELERTAALDALTGLYNRRAFDHRLESEWLRGIRDQSTLSLLMIDIDFFKRYNDTLGHPAGDTCIQAVADVLQRNAQRAGDMAVRYGGEEFAVILPGTDRGGAAYIASRIIADIRELQLPHHACTLGYVTVSIGIASVRPTQDKPFITVATLADRALYTAKRSGRNRIEHYSPANSFEQAALMVDIPAQQ